MRFMPRSITMLKGYKLNALFCDLGAGLSVAIVALPLAMAFAIASGVGPEKGLFTAIIAGFLISFLGGSRYQIGGPTGAFVVVLYATIAKHGYDGLLIAIVLAGIMLILMGLFKLGSIIKFIPYPVTVGFTTGIALIIFTSQIKDFFGMNIEKLPAEFSHQWQVYAQNSNNISLWALAIGLFSIAIIMILKRVFPKVPAPIVIVLLMSAFVSFFNIPVDTIGSRFGDIPSMLPSPSLPSFSMEKIRAVFPDAMTIALLGAIESLLSAVIADGMTGDRHHSNKELVAQGVANIACASFGGIAATGAIARTATNIKAGAYSPLSGMFHALFLLGFMFFFAKFIVLIPLSALAAILIIVAWNMSELHHFKSIILNSERYDTVVLLTTFLLTVLIDLNTGVQVGIMLAALLFIKRTIDVTQIVDTRDAFKGIQGASSDLEELFNDPDALSQKIVPDFTDVYEINGPFFFGVADRLKGVLDAISSPPQVFILRMRNVPMVDETGYHALEEFYELCARKNTTLILSGVNSALHKRLNKKGFNKLLGSKNITNHIDIALQRARDIVNENKEKFDKV